MCLSGLSIIKVMIGVTGSGLCDDYSDQSMKASFKRMFGIQNSGSADQALQIDDPAMNHWKKFYRWPDS